MTDKYIYTVEDDDTSFDSDDEDYEIDYDEELYGPNQKDVWVGQRNESLWNNYILYEKEYIPIEDNDHLMSFGEYCNTQYINSIQ